MLVLWGRVGKVTASFHSRALCVLLHLVLLLLDRGSVSLTGKGRRAGVRVALGDCYWAVWIVAKSVLHACIHCFGPFQLFHLVWHTDICQVTDVGSVFLFCAFITVVCSTDLCRYICLWASMSFHLLAHTQTHTLAVSIAVSWYSELGETDMFRQPWQHTPVKHLPQILLSSSSHIDL